MTKKLLCFQHTEDATGALAGNLGPRKEVKRTVRDCSDFIRHSSEAKELSARNAGGESDDA